MPIKKNMRADANNSFVKTLKKTTFVSMTIPAAFVRAHKHNMTTRVAVWFHGCNVEYPVHITANFQEQYAHVAFGGGWKDFLDSHDLKEGDHIKVDLVRKSCFRVTLLAAAGTGSASRAVQGEGSTNVK